MAEAEELAFLIKDNLHMKHFILSSEESFLELLKSPFRGSENLELKPMGSYQRMLLHRLADLFGLEHESIGEGDNRHLVITRSEESSVPSVLVRDLLVNSFGEPSTKDSSFHSLLKRSLTESGETTSGSDQPSVASLEERQAAYISARERIFSGFESSQEQARPPHSPVVARRMITHALGGQVTGGEQGGSSNEGSRVRRRPDMPGRAAIKIFSQAIGIQDKSKK